MKKLLFKLTLPVFFLGLTTGCSSGGGGGAAAVTPPPVSEFSQSLAGKWVSECMPSQEGNYKETLEIANTHTGTSFRTFYPNVSCAGSDAGVTPVQNFTYQEGAPVNNLTPVTLTVEGQGSTTIQISIFNRTMDVIDANGQRARYTRINTANATPGQNPVLDLDVFDSLAMGIWVSQSCEAGAQVRTSTQEILSIHGGGRADSSYKTYQNSDCSGTGRVINQQTFSYSVDRFMNGAGLIKVNDQLVEVSFQNNFMTMNSAQSSATYTRIQ